MALTVTDKRGGEDADTHGSITPLTFHYEDVTDYRAGGWTPKSAMRTNPYPVGIQTLWQETMDLVLRYDASNHKIKAYVMSTGAEVADATDIGEVKYFLVYNRE